jgi:hypothetical protein
MGDKTEILALTRLTETDENMAGLSRDDIDLIVALSHVYEDEHWVSLGRLERKPGKNDNWIESVGKLPAYIEEVAVSLHEKRGMPISRAIATAISRIKKWAVTGKADTKAKAAKAIAQWEALKAKAKAKRAAK